MPIQILLASPLFSRARFSLPPLNFYVPLIVVRELSPAGCQGAAIDRHDEWAVHNAFPQCILSNGRQTRAALPLVSGPTGSNALAFRANFVSEPRLSQIVRCRAFHKFDPFFLPRNL
jgi:hypothetical protein